MAVSMMSRFGLAAAVLFAGLQIAFAVPLEAYARLPLYENVAISPDGLHVAFLTHVGDEREIIIQTLGDQFNAIRFKVGEKRIRGISWESPDHLLISVSELTVFSRSEIEFGWLRVYDLNRKKLFDPLDFKRTRPWATDSSPVVDSTSNEYMLLFGSLFEGSGLFRFDLQQQTMTLLDSVPDKWIRWHQWMVGREGQLLARTTYNEKESEWSMSNISDHKWTTRNVELVKADPPQLLGLNRDQETMAVVRPENGQQRVQSISLIDGRWADELPAGRHGDKYLVDPTTHELIGSIQYGARRHYKFFDNNAQAAWDRAVDSFAGEEIELVNWSNSLQKMIVKVFGPKSGAGYALVDNTSGAVSYLGNLYFQIEANDLLSVKPVSYLADDGMTITGYLTVPRGNVTKKMPLVVLPHDGPAAHSFLEFNWLAQTLASRGYMVLDPNFRGSLGDATKLHQAGYGEWGRKMQADLSDGVRALVKLELVDPKRVCIVGAGYGGYAALNGVVAESDTYRCAVSIAGISDLKQWLQRRLGNGAIRENSRVRYDLRYFDAERLSDPVLAERSPARHADQVKAPILLIHGDNDSVVPFEQSQLMANALRKAGKPYELVKLKSEDHWLSKADTRLQMLQAVVKFLEVNNPP
jgi:dipeptidyl aminopeptidase/acylaminoacyl peptidase